MPGEDSELKRKADAKQELGYVPRPKTGVRGANQAIQHFLSLCCTPEEYASWLQSELSDVLEDLQGESSRFCSAKGLATELP